jgi:hypothetical protein
MAGLPWIKVATDFGEHPKALALSSRLNDPRAPLHLPPVWGYYARYYRDGSMPDSEDAIRALERAALWNGAPGTLVAALLDVGLIDRKRKRLVVHGWEEWQEGHTRKLERDRERMRAKRAESRSTSRTTVERGSRDRRGIEERKRRGEEEDLGEQASDPGLTPGAAPAAGSLARSLEEHQGSSHDQNTSKAATGAQGDDPPPRKLLVLDSTEIRNTTAAEARAAVEIALGRRLLVAKAGGEEAAEKSWTDLVRRAEEAKPDGWKAKIVQLAETADAKCRTLQAKRGEPLTGMMALTYLLPSLAEALELAQPPARPSIVKKAMAASPEWGRLLEYLQAHLRPDLLARWFAPLMAHTDGDALVLEAPDQYHADFLAHAYLPWMLEEGPRIAGVTGTIRIEAKAQLQEAIA